jgi:hypothetical protein
LHSARPGFIRQTEWDKGMKADVPIVDLLWQAQLLPPNFTIQALMFSIPDLKNLVTMAQLPLGRL